ncbi:MAG: hypothetical protein GXO47_02025 [Chlorobi bacterium]|nr:hypothetical protein [Chlorobiota bacterium]
MKKLSLFILLTVFVNSYAQEEPARKKFDIRFGLGWSLLGTGDLGAFNFENEFNFRFSRYFTASASFSFGRVTSEREDVIIANLVDDSGNIVYSSTEILNWPHYGSFLQGNINIFISPFRNNRFNDFRIGAGISVYNMSEAYVQGYSSVPDEWRPVYGDYFVTWDDDKRTSLGWNLIIEDTFIFKEKFLIGVKAFTQPYINGDINSGFMGKLGYVF